MVNVGAGTGSYEPPDPDDSFDAAMTILTVHHWCDLAAGLAELVRVASRRVVVVTCDRDFEHELWIVRDYLPEIAADRERWLPPLARILEGLPAATVEPIPIPRDCSDRMFAALWARPEDYLDPEIRRATSVWHHLPDGVEDRAIGQLTADLESGAWDERYGHLRETREWDAGLRLVTAEV